MTELNNNFHNIIIRNGSLFYQDDTVFNEINERTIDSNDIIIFSGLHFPEFFISELIENPNYNDMGELFRSVIDRHKIHSYVNGKIVYSPWGEGVW